MAGPADLESWLEKQTKGQRTSSLHGAQNWSEIEQRGEELQPAITFYEQKVGERGNCWCLHFR